MMKKHLLWKNAVLALSLMLLSVGTFAQQHEVKGTVLDESQLPIPGANVVIKGTTVGTITTGNGEFTMNAADGDVLQVSYIGYNTEEITVNGNGPYNISLVLDMVGLDEVVVVGYGVQKKSNVTGAIASVKAEDLERRSSTSAVQALQGKASGVQVINSSAAPGKDSDIRVRGYSSNSDKIAPLLIVDGLKVESIQYLDPSMIESMEILKDAASAAIYGAEAGNGVVLITTKSGGKQEGKIFYNFQYTTSKLGNHAKMMNADQYMTWHMERKPETYKSKEDFTKLHGYVDGTDTNWSDVAFDKGVTQRHTLGAQGGNDKGSYYIAITNLEDNGILTGNKDVYKRLSAQINADYKIKKWFSVSSNTSIEKYSKKELGEHNEYASGGSVLLGATVLDPLSPVYYDNDNLPDDIKEKLENPIVKTRETYKEITDGDHKGYYEKVKVNDTLGFQTIYGDEKGYYAKAIMGAGDGVNPLVTIARRNKTEEGFNVRGTLSADLKPFKGLVLTSRFGYSLHFRNEFDYSEPYYYNDKNEATDYTMSASANTNYYYQWENFANYNTSIGAHNVGAMVGMSYIEDHKFNVGGRLTGNSILKDYADNFRYLEYYNTDENLCQRSITGGTPRESVNMSYFGRLSWDYADKYNVQVNFRTDAFDSSKLAGKNRWGKFPSVSAGWTMSKEDFLLDILSAATVSYLKLRASWGQNGNISVLTDYPYSVDVSLNSQSYQFDTQSGLLTYGSFPNGLANPDLKWETSEQIDLGLDGRLLNDKLTFAIDYYKKTTKDLLVKVKPPREYGVSETTMNAGKVVNQGLEFELGWKDKIGDFVYSVSANAATLKNEVTYLDPSVDIIRGAKFSNFTLQTAFQKGHSVWYMRGYEYAGVNDNGEALFKTATGETTTTPTIDDERDLGQGIPKFTYGLTVNLAYKNFDFTLFGNGIRGNKIFACNYRTEHFEHINGMEVFFNGRSTVNEDGTLNKGKYPTVKNMAENTDFFSSSANLFDGSYFKIKQIQLGYTIPNELTKKLAIESFRMFVALDDYFTFTKYEGFDPEVAANGTANSIGFDKGSYPTSKKVTFGLNLTF